MLRGCYKLVPLWGGVRGCLGACLSLAFDVVGDLVYLVEDVAVAVYEFGDFGGRVHDGGVVAAAEGLADLGQ